MQVPHSWLAPASLDEARQVQYLLADQVRVSDDFQPIRMIGGMDVSNNPYDPLQMVYASTVLLDFSTMAVVEKCGISERQTFPYITGFLGFREAPALVKTFDQLKVKPDLILVDGHGISHPRRLGIASHIGVLLDIPTIGVAKTILVGKLGKELPLEPGSTAPLIWKNQTIGMMLRTKKRTNPLIISAGHRVSLETAVDIVQQSLRGYRLPEPTRQAHLAANEYRMSSLPSSIKN